MTGTRGTPAERLNRSLVRRSNGCLEWTLHVTRKGYGAIKVSGKTITAHRLAWELEHGPIPPGIHVLHHCDNPPCCQTDPTEGYPNGHLFLGTDADNAADRDVKGRHWQMGKDRCPQGHLYDEANTRITPVGGRACRACDRDRARRRRAKARIPS